PSQFLFVGICESEIKRAGFIQLDINPGFFAKRLSEFRIKIAAGARQAKKVIRLISFDLWPKHSAGGPTGFLTGFAALDQRHFAHAALGQHKRDRKRNEAEANEEDFGAFRIEWIASLNKEVR